MSVHNIYPSDIKVGIYFRYTGNEILAKVSRQLLIERVLKRVLVTVKATVLLQVCSIVHKVIKYHNLPRISNLASLNILV